MGKAAIIGAVLAGAAQICLASGGIEETRALGPVRISNDNGQQVMLYRESHALLVGVSQYDDPTIADLDNIRAEMDTLQRTLEGRGFTVTRVDDPDSDELEFAFRRFIREHGYDPENRLLFFYAGHGYSLSDNTEGFILPRDAPNPSRDEPGFRARALNMTRVNAWCREMTARHVLFAFDSCFSGVIFKSRNIADTTPPQIADYMGRPVRQFVTAGDAGETVPSVSVFLPMFVRILEGRVGDLNGDGYITATEMGMVLRDRVIDYQTGQTPQFGKLRDPRFDEGEWIIKVPSRTVPRARPETPSLSEPVGRDEPEVDYDAIYEEGERLYSTKEYGRAAPLLKQAAEEGYEEAQFRLGYMYRYGLGVEKDAREAERYYEMASRQGHTMAQNNLGYLLLMGEEGVEKDDARAFELFREAAENGNVRAMTSLGYMYDKGRYAAENDVRAVEFYRKAAEKGFAQAQANLGYMYRDGTGVARDYEESVRWFRMAAEQGDDGAQFQLGYAYDKGRGTNEDPYEAARLYEEAVAQGHVQAQANLGYLYKMGRGVPRDYAKSVELFREAALKGNRDGQFQLGYAYKNGLGVTADSVEAAYWYEKAAAQGHAAARNNLGHMILNGEGLAKNDARAFELFQEAAEQGNVRAMTSLGWMYDQGRHVSENDSQAVYWYRKAAEGGFAQGQYNLGYMYTNGYGVAQDLEQAKYWVRLAAKQGHTDALKWLENRNLSVEETSKRNEPMREPGPRVPGYR